MEASQAEKNIFGEDVKLHPITKMPLEQGHGALPAEMQALHHCDHIEREHGKHIADAVRRQLAAGREVLRADAELHTALEEEHGHNAD